MEGVDEGGADAVPEVSEELLQALNKNGKPPRIKNSVFLINNYFDY